MYLYKGRFIPIFILLFMSVLTEYFRLNDSHKRVQKLNQVLEEKLLQMVDKMKGEKSQLTKDIATLSVRLAESKHNYSMLQKENVRTKIKNIFLNDIY